MLFSTERKPHKSSAWAACMAEAWNHRPCPPLPSPRPRRSPSRLMIPHCISNTELFVYVYVSRLLPLMIRCVLPIFASSAASNKPETEGSLSMSWMNMPKW